MAKQSAKDQKPLVEKYISAQSPEAQRALTKIRSIIRKAAPKASEVISYSMPAFKMNKVIVWYAAAKNHLGLYVYPVTKNKFKDRLSEYTQTKSAIHFPYDEALPAGLISDIVKASLSADQAKAPARKSAAKKRAPKKTAAKRKAA